MLVLPKLGEIVKVYLPIVRPKKSAEWPWAIVRAVHKKTWDGEINNYLLDHSHGYGFADLVRFREVQQTIDGERYSRWQAIMLVEERSEEMAAQERAAQARRRIEWAQLVSKRLRETGHRLH